jgi:pimeloyl-ACP methyl ester carboxylesterase
MQYQEYGRDKAETIFLLHGGGLSWWNFKNEAELLQSSYHVILPILDGHADSDQPFSTIENNASEIISFIDEHFGGSVLLIGGLSLGAQILLEMMSQRANICRYALVESAAVHPSGLTNAMIRPALASSYWLIRNKSFARIQFSSLHLQKELFEEYYRDTCKIGKENMIAFLKASTAYSLKTSISGAAAKTLIIVGGRENREIQQSAKTISQAIQDSRIMVMPGLYHGEFSINQPERYMQMITEMLEE